MTELFIPQKTIPRSSHETREAKSKPGIVVKRTRLEGLQVDVLGKPHGTNGDVHIETVSKEVNFGREITIFEVSPFVKQPLTPTFQKSIGGHTTGGGGTSKEALRRAKQKAKKSPHK